MTSISGKKSSPRLPVRRHEGGSMTRPPRRVGSALCGSRALLRARADELLGLLGVQHSTLLVDVDLFVLVPLQLLSAALLLLGRHRLSMPRG